MSTRSVAATALAALLAVTGLSACNDASQTPGSDTVPRGGGNVQMQ